MAEYPVALRVVDVQGVGRLTVHACARCGTPIVDGLLVHGVWRGAELEGVRAVRPGAAPGEAEHACGSLAVIAEQAAVRLADSSDPAGQHTGALPVYGQRFWEVS